MVITIVAARQLLVLSARAGRGRALHGEAWVPRYIPIVASLWRRFFIATVVVYAVQENAERILAGGMPPGLDALVAHGPLPILVIALSSSLVAAVVALVRWRTRALVARIRSATAFARHARAPRRRIVRTRPRDRAWAAATASRAPPMAAPSA
jgi:hypothetical protein